MTEVKTLTQCGHTWLWCPPEGEHKGYWHNTTGKRKVRIFEPTPGVSTAWLVEIASTGEIIGITGDNAKECAFEFAAKRA